MTSIVEPAAPGRRISWIRTLLLLGMLMLCALGTPRPWAALWLLVPGVVALALLLSWRWGPWGVAVPVLLLGLVMVLAGPLTPWVWWIPVSALTGAWMGLREEGGGPSAGDRAWMLVPLLLLAASLPWALSYPDLVSRVEGQMREGDRQLLELSRQIGYQGERLQSLQRSMAESAATQKRVLPNLLPSLLFLWMTVLVVAGRRMSSRIASALKWPELSRARLADLRLPDAVLWLFLLGLALLVAGLESWAPTAWTLLVIPGLGYCVQGVAVVESLLLARGVTPSIITLTMVFVFVMATPVFLLSTVCVGVSDVWLDYRRIEAVPDDSSS